MQCCNDDLVQSSAIFVIFHKTHVFGQRRAKYYEKYDFEPIKV